MQHAELLVAKIGFNRREKWIIAYCMFVNNADGAETLTT